MGNSQPTGTTLRKTQRLEAFQDAVLAIAMTLPLLELILPPVGQGGDLAGAYAGRATHLLAYLSSVLVIGVYWAHSHFAGKIVRATDHNMNLLSLLFIIAVSLTSVPNTPFFQHIGDADNVGLAATVYAWTLAAPSVVELLRWLYSLRAGLVDADLEPGWVRSMTIRYAAWALGFVVAAGVTTIGFWQAGMAMSGLLILTYLPPPADPRYREGCEPETDIEEADERDEAQVHRSGDIPAEGRKAA